MPTKPIGLSAGNKFTPADDASGLSGLPAATGLTGQVPQANGGLGVDASALSNGVLVKSGGVMSSTTTPTMSGVNITDGTLRLDSIAAQGANPNSVLRWNGTAWGVSSTGTANYLLTSGASAPGWSNALTGINIDAATNSLSNVGTSMLAAGFNLAATQGGTGHTLYTVGDVLYASTTTALSRLAAGTSGYLLTSNGAGVAPSYQAPVTATTYSASLSAASYSLTTNDWEDIGLSQASIPAGKYKVTAEVRSAVACSVGNGYIVLELYDATAGAAIANSERIGAVAATTGVGYSVSTTITEPVTLSTTSTLKVYAKSPAGFTYTGRDIYSDADGRSRLLIEKIGP